MGPRQISGLSPGLSRPTEMNFQAVNFERLDAVCRPGTSGWALMPSQSAGRWGVDVGVEQAYAMAEFG